MFRKTNIKSLKKNKYMGYKNTNLYREVDNELKIFRKLCNNVNNDSIHLLISHGGVIAQHLIEVLARANNKNIDYDIYSGYFEDFLDNECKFIPQHIRGFVLTLQEYRYSAVDPEKYENELYGGIISFLEFYSQFLVVFRNYFHIEWGNEKDRFYELQPTISFLSEKISELKNPNNNELYQQDIVHLLQQILQNQEREHQEHKTHSRQLNEVKIEVKNLNKQLIELNTKITDYKKDVQEALKNKNSEEKEEIIISKFANKCIKRIRNSLEDKIVGTHEYTVEENKLIDSLGKSAWGKLSRQSKTFLTTAKITFNSLNNLEDTIDYSGVCLLVTKSLEVELCKRFYKGFSDYLWKEFHKDYSKYHTSLIKEYQPNVYSRLKKPKDCDLGRITCILGYNKWGITSEEQYNHNMLRIIEYSKINYFNDLTNDEIREKIVYYGELVDEVRRDYRNPAAHTSELKCPDAKACFDFIIDAEQILKIMLDSFDK